MKCDNCINRHVSKYGKCENKKLENGTVFEICLKKHWEGGLVNKKELSQLSQLSDPFKDCKDYAIHFADREKTYVDDVPTEKRMRINSRLSDVGFNYIGNIIGVTTERARQIFVNSIKKMKKYVVQNNIKSTDLTIDPREHVVYNIKDCEINQI